MTDNLVLDDLRVPFGPIWEGKDVHVVKTSAEAIAWFEANPKHHLYTLCLDHDLGIVDGDEDTAVPVGRYLANRAKHGQMQPISQVYIHTSNRSTGGGAWELESALKPYYPVQIVDAKQIGLIYL